jgi:tetratricopeptide (TPR) repeat protein
MRRHYAMICERTVAYISAAAVFVAVCLFAFPAFADQKQRIAVLQFSNESKDSSLDWLGAVLVDCLSRGLGAVREIEVVDSSRVTRALTELNLLSADLARQDNITKIGKRLAADTLFIGSYKKADNRITVTLEMVSIAQEKAPRAQRDITSDEPPVSLIGSVGLVILEQLKVKASDTSNLVKKPTESVEAFELYGKGLLFKKSEKTYDKAIEAFIAATKKDPKFAPPHFHLGCLFVVTGMLKPGVREYLKAINLDPDYAEAYNNLGVVYAQLGRAESALEAYSSAIAKNPSLSDAHCNLGKLFDAQGKHDDAIKEYNLAVKLSPNDAVTYNNLAVAYLNKGSKEEAEKAYLCAIQLDPDLKEAHLGLALIYDNQNQKEKAILHYEKYLELGGVDTEIKERLEELKKT